MSDDRSNLTPNEPVLDNRRGTPDNREQKTGSSTPAWPRTADDDAADATGGTSDVTSGSA